MDHEDEPDEADAVTDTSGDVFDDDDPDAPNLVPETDPPSRVLPGGIELRQLIGEGGMGQVFRGYHLRLECDVAVKVLDPELQLRVDSQERLLREGAVLASIRHENIVQVHHCATTDDGKVFVVMELLEGETLRQLWCRVGKLDALAVVKIGLQICRALERAHEAGVIHRDITPSNVMVLHEPAGLVKLIDFGICRVLDAYLARHPQRFAKPPGSRLATPMGVQLGNPEYMAPELFVRVPFVKPNVCTDVFSVAVVLFEALTGKHPFRRGDREQAYTVRDLMPEFEYIELEQALSNALRCDPGTRTPTMAALREDLDLAHDCILAQRGVTVDGASGAAQAGARLLRLDTLRSASRADDEEPRARFLEVVRGAPDDGAREPEPSLAPVVSLRPALPVVTEPIDDPDDDSPTVAVAAAVFVPPSQDLAVVPMATQGWFAAHASSLLLGAGIVAGVGATLASQRLGDSTSTTPARVTELEAAVDACEQALEETHASLAQTREDLGNARELALADLGSSRSEASPVAAEEHPVTAEERPATAATSTPPTSAPHRGPGIASAARHRSIRRSLGKVLAAVKKCDDDAGGGRLSRLRARIRVEPSGEASAVELTDGASIAVCVTEAVRSRRYQVGEVAEWVRHDFVFDSEEETP